MKALHLLEERKQLRKTGKHYSKTAMSKIEKTVDMSITIKANINDSAVMDDDTSDETKMSYTNSNGEIVTSAGVHEH